MRYESIDRDSKAGVAPVEIGDRDPVNPPSLLGWRDLAIMRLAPSRRLSINSCRLEHSGPW
jgi:hypothetical protein